MASLESVKAKSGTFWRITYMWQGRRERFKVGITNRKTALQRKAQIETLIASGRNPKLEEELTSKSEKRVSDLKTQDRDWSRNRFQPGTLRICAWAIDQFIEWAGDPLISEVNKPMIERFITHLYQELHRSETTVNMVLRQLKAVFQRAIAEHGMLSEHPFKTVKTLAQPKSARKPNYLSTEQVSSLINAVSEVHFGRLVRFYLWTGCRRTEALELTWKDIDTQNGVLYLGQSNSKTKIRRDFPLTPKIAGLLEELKSDMLKDEPVFWRFKNAAPHISHKIGQIQAKVEGLPDTLTTHSLRHTFASHLVMAGVDLTTVAALLGHTTTKTTELYSHLLPDHKKTSAERLPY